MKKLLSIFFLIIISFVNVYSQKAGEIRLQIITPESDNPENYKLKKHTFKVKDSTVLYKKLIKIKKDLIQSGYLAASIDSVPGDSSGYCAYLNVGPLYKWEELSFKDIDNEASRSSGINESDFKDRKINLKKLKATTEQLVSHYENIGYPFVRYGIDSLSIKDRHFNGKLYINKNHKIHIDTILIKGKVNISKKLIYKYIGIKPGDLFNQRKIDHLDKNLSRLPYIESAKPAELEFIEKKADIHIYLKKRKSNLFNGIIGFATDENEENKLKFAGNLKFDLNNSFGIGEHIDLYWENYKDSSQLLSIGTAFPYLFVLPVGIKASFQLDKESLDYLNVNYSLALTYDIKPRNNINIYFNQRRSYVVGNEVEVQARFDNINNYTFGLSIGIDKTNRLILPRKGFNFKLSTGYGYRWAEQKGNSYMLEAGFYCAYYWQLSNNLTFILKNASKGMFNDIGFYENEMYKIGGVKSVRGFDEKSLLASSYSIFTFEPRFFISNYSFVSIFTDYIYFEENAIDLNNNNYGVGLGSGISIDSKAGIFSLNFAVGKLNDNPFRLSNTKLHFGYSARF
ncbi:MAG: BamA/TamA family outer membrane protein [Bacteroidota bacterium]